MSKKPFSPHNLVDIHGRPIDLDRLRGLVGQLRAEAAPSTQTQPSAAERQQVFDALALSGMRRGVTQAVDLLRELGWKRDDGSAFATDAVQAAQQALAKEGQLHAPDGQAYAATDAAQAERLPALLARREAGTWWRVVARRYTAGYLAAEQLPVYLSLRSDQEARALLRLVLISGLDLESFNELAERWGSLLEPRLLRLALSDLLAADALKRVQRDLWWLLLDQAATVGSMPPALLTWVAAHVDADRQLVPVNLLLVQVERRLHLGDIAGMRSLLAGPELNFIQPLFEAALLAHTGQWHEAALAFAEALKNLGTTLGRRKNLVPGSLLQWYLLALLAQPEAKHWQTARKLAVAESGSRQPSEMDAWGRWVHAIDVRLGDAKLLPASLQLERLIDHDPEGAADGPILAAWIGQTLPPWPGARLQALADGLLASGWPWKAELLRQACVRLKWPTPVVPPSLWPVRYFGEATAAWRDALVAMAALGETKSAAPGGSGLLRWLLHLDGEGRPMQLEAFEPSSSGRGKPKPVSLVALKKRTRLEAQDAAVARAIKAMPYDARRVQLDLVAAVLALIGHPDLVLADAPAERVELIEALPALQVRRDKAPNGQDGFVFELDDPLLERSPAELKHHFEAAWSSQELERERRNSLRIRREAAGRARLVRIGPAQRRVAELVAQRWQVPLEAKAELDAALRALAGHFQLHSDAEAGEPVPSCARLVARLEPKGQALRLQLAVQPFGEFGPLLVPGQGRARLMTLHKGLSLATERQIDSERAHMASLLAELPELGDEADATWLLDEPGHTLAVVEALNRLVAQQHPALRALEWPRGRSLRVLASQSMKAKLSSGRDWFSLQGELQLDEGRVLSLQRVLALLRDAQGSRFLALGDGEYLALTEHLRQRLADLDALAEADGDKLRVGRTAANWLHEAADELGLQGDARWRERAAVLQAAFELQPAVPAGLQAELRPYQREGFEWLARLAEAGFGAVLADDMGLGKTVQTLALMLHRAERGPTLIVAPTSVCANWVLEAARFAPSLQVHDHAVTDRSVGQPGPGQVLVVSYALLLRDAEALQAVNWATLVLDEAQALKNAATQRVKAVAALNADCRVALSGTPVENRLSDLWSLMHLLNPGLLGNANRFAERFANPIERSGDAAARGRLRRLVSPFLLRRTKAQVLTDLPPRTEIVHRIEPSSEERAFLDAARRESLARIAELDPASGQQSFNVLAELTRLRRAACDPRLIAPELGLIGAKAQAFEQLAIELVEGRHRALVFSQFTDFLKLLAERLDAAGLRYQYLDGSTPAAQRAERVAAFQRGESELFLISLKAGGFGLNLTAADYVVIADPWWNPAAEDQAMGRAHRIGQLRPVTVYRLVTAGSVEERIVSLHANKRELADSVLSDQQGAAPLQADELLDLLRDD